MKKLITIFVTAMLMTSLVACGDKEEEKDTKDTKSASSNSVKKDTPKKTAAPEIDVTETPDLELDDSEFFQDNQESDVIMTMDNWHECAERWLGFEIEVPEGWTATGVEAALLPETGTVTFTVSGDITPEAYAETIFGVTKGLAVKSPYKFTGLEDDVISTFEDSKLSTANEEKSAGWYYGLNDSWTGIRCIKFTYTDTTCSWYIA